MTKQANFAVYLDVYLDVYWAVDDAVRRTVGWAVAVDEAVNRAVYLPVDWAVEEAVRGGLPHPGLQDFLINTKVEV